MKCSIVHVVVMSALVTGVAYANSPYDIETPVGKLVNESLDGFGYSVRVPVEGEIWELGSPSMKVLQVVKGGVLVTRNTYSSEAPSKNFIVRTSRRYADDDILAPGYYRAIGTVSYQSVIGAQLTVYAFSEIAPDEQQAIIAFKQDKTAVAAARRQAAEERRRRVEQTVEFKKSKERIAAEEAAEKERLERERIERENAAEIAKLTAAKDNRIAAMKANAEAEANLQKAEHAREMARLAREREEQDAENRKRIAAAKAEKRQADAKLASEIQKERGRYAADALSTLDFNFKHHYVTQRSIRKNVCVEISDPLWKNLANLQLKQDWLGMLGAMEDEEYNEFPKEKEVDSAIDRLKRRLFTIQVKAMRPPSCVSVWAGHVKDRHHDRNCWGRISIFCKDPTMDRVKSLDDVKGEELQIDLFNRKFYVCNSDERAASAKRPLLIRDLKAGEHRDGDIDEMAAEAEEWLKAN